MSRFVLYGIAGLCIGAFLGAIIGLILSPKPAATFTIFWTSIAVCSLGGIVAGAYFGQWVNKTNPFARGGGQKTDFQIAVYTCAYATLLYGFACMVLISISAMFPAYIPSDWVQWKKNGIISYPFVIFALLLGVLSLWHARKDALRWSRMQPLSSSQMGWRVAIAVVLTALANSFLKDPVLLANSATIMSLFGVMLVVSVFFVLVRTVVRKR